MDCEYPIGFLYLVCKERERKHEKMEKVYGNRFGSIYDNTIWCTAADIGHQSFRQKAAKR